MPCLKALATVVLLHNHRHLLEPICLKWSPTSFSLCVIRNVSSADEKTRQLMREAKGLVDSLVTYIKACVDKSRAEEKVRLEAAVSHSDETLLCLCIHLFAL